MPIPSYLNISPAATLKREPSHLFHTFLILFIRNIDAHPFVLHQQFIIPLFYQRIRQRKLHYDLGHN